MFKVYEEFNIPTNNPVQVAFFDLGEDGKLDVIALIASDKDDGSKIYQRNCYFNNVKDDTLFIKISPLSISSLYEDHNGYISSSFGVTMEWTITQLDGNKKIQLVNQRSQLNYGTLQLPYVSAGLGRTNNYV